MSHQWSVGEDVCNVTLTSTRVISLEVQGRCY